MNLPSLLLPILVVTQTVSAESTQNNCNPINDQNLITNGSFEDIELDTTEFGVRLTKTHNIPGWKVSGGPKGMVIANYPHSGNNMLRLASNEGYKLSQTINTKPGQHYLLKFWSRFHRPQYNTFDIQFLNHSATACGTKNNYTITTQADWGEDSYILCPDTHNLTVEFSQLRDTGGGFGIHLDTISLVPCTVGRPTPETLTFLNQTWVHAFEEDNKRTLIWRRAGSRAFPATRFRRTLSLYQGGQCQFLSLEPNNAHQLKTCRWRFDPTSNQLTIRETSGQIAGHYELNSLTQDLLSISQ